MENIYIYSDHSETQELCPSCMCEVTIKIDGKSSCPECGHKEVLPCSQCKLGGDDFIECDWNQQTRCTPFPRVGGAS